MIPGTSRSRCVLLLVASLVPTACRTTLSPYRPARADRARAGATVDAATSMALLATIDDAVNRQRVPGLQAAMTFSDGSRWTGISGTADIRRRLPLGKDVVFRVGSLTKPYTAVVVLQLVDERRLSLDDTIARWFPEFPNAGRMTVRQLLSHRSGAPEVLRSTWIKVRSSFAGYRWKPDQLVKIASGLRPQSAPGERFAYSNTNYILLGLIAERVTGQPIARLIRERIAEPLSLANTRLLPDEPTPSGLVSGYDRDMIPFPGFYKMAPGDRSWASVAFTAGGMSSTAEELSIFIDALFRGSILSKPSADAMRAFEPAPMEGTPEQRGYGLGLEQLDVGGVEYWGHIGTFIGFTAAAVYVPSRRVTIAVAGNVSTFDVMRVVADLDRTSHLRKESDR